MLNFIELRSFSNRWSKLQLTEDDLLALQIEIMMQPDRAPVIAGTGGLRKMRFVPARANQGKSGAYRICYASFPDYSLILLVTIYSKTEQDDLSPDDRKAIKSLLAITEAQLAESPHHWRVETDSDTES